MSQKHRAGAAPGPRKRRWPWWLLGGLAFLAGSYAYFQYGVVDTQLKPLIERKLAEAVHGPVVIRSVRAGLTGNVVLNQVDLNIPGSPWESRLAVDQVSVNVQLFNLLFHRKPLEDCLDSLSFIRPQITLTKMEAPAASVSAPGGNPSAPPAIPIPVFPVQKVSVREGSFSIQAGKSPRPVLKLLNFDAIGNGTVWGLSLLAHSPEENSQGILQFNGSLRLENVKVRGVVRLTQWPLASAGPALLETTGWDLSAGTIDGESPFVFQLGRSPWYDAKADVHGASLRSPDPVGITFSQITGRAFIRPTGINVPEEVQFHVGDTAWKASGALPFDGRPLQVRTSTDQLFLDSVFNDILKIKNLKTGGQGTAELSVTGTFSEPIVEGTAQLGPSNVGDWQMDAVSLKAGYENGTVKLEQSDGKIYGGSLNANGFYPLTGQPDAPVSLTVDLKNVEAMKVASTLGVSGTSGRISQEVHYGGTVSHPIISASGDMALTRVLRNSVVQYSIHNSIQLSDQKLQVWASLNDKSRLEAVFTAEADDWKMEKFLAVSGKKTLKLTGRGTWPKTEDKPIQIEVKGRAIALENLPIFNDQFPDLSGLVDLDLLVGGTKAEPTATVRLSSDQVLVQGMEPQPLALSLTWKPGQLQFEKLIIGDIFSAQGTLGLSPDSPNDLKIAAEEFPIQLVAEISQWNNPPQPFEGSVTGHLHLGGTAANPILEGDDIAVESLKVGDWYADKVQASLDMVDGKLLVKQLKLSQGGNSLTVDGSWDTRPGAGNLDLRFTAEKFQLGDWDAVTGEFSLDAKTTGDPFWKNWTGIFASKAFTFTDAGGREYHFTDFSMPTSCEDLVYRSRVTLAGVVMGSAVLDESVASPTIQALLKIEPTMLTQVPELTQFLPPSLKVKGMISGELKLEKGTFDELPMEGSFTVVNGSIQKYDFDRAELILEGTKSKISSKFSLAREEARYSLSGTLSSPRSFWDPDSQVSVNGPVEHEKLRNILSLLGIDTEKHHVGGEVNGNLAVSGSLAAPVADFTVGGENLRYDNNVVPEAQLHFAYSGGKITVEKDNQITLPAGQIDIEQGIAYLDPQDPSVAVLDLWGSTRNLPIAFIHFTSQLHLAGRLALEEKEERPTFDGLLSVIETEVNAKKPIPFDIAMSVHDKKLEFKPMDNPKPQLVGEVDLSQGQKFQFNNLRLVNDASSFSVNGLVDLNGPCSLVSDSKNVPIQEIGKWILPDFPLSGTGSYHLVFEGTVDAPIFTGSLSVQDGQVGDLKFDLLDGEVKASNDTLYLGDAENPITLSREGVFTFALGGHIPLALTEEAKERVRNQEMDVTAKMEKGDFSLILLAGWAKKASGDMDFSAHLGGTLDDPDVTMDLDLNQCQLVPPMVAQSIDDLNGRIKVRHNHLAVEDLNARIGQGRVFITSPPVDQSKMVLVDFIPQYLDFQVKTIGSHGLWLSIPDIMRKGEWGEIYFYGPTPSDPLLIQGPIDSPTVKGTALLDTGHYTFPPEEQLDEHGQKIEYRELAGVNFDLYLVSGKNTWYSNEFNTQYLELKVDPGDKIHIFGRDIDRGTEQGGIKCEGSAGSKYGWLRYLGHEFQMQESSITMTRVQPPRMEGYATDVFPNVNVLTAGGVRQVDLNVRVDFEGNFGNIDFKLSSDPSCAPASYGEDASKNILYSYVMFGTDMTGLTTNNTAATPDQLKAAYQQRVGQVVDQTALDLIDRMASSQLTGMTRSVLQQVAGVDINVETNIAGANSGSVSSPGVLPAGPDATGNSTGASNVSLFRLKIRKPLDQRLSLMWNPGLAENFTPQNQLGLQYDLNRNLSFNATTGENNIGQEETQVGIQFQEALPDIMQPKRGDKDRPRFMRLDATSIGPGKFHVVWETDKVTQCEVRVMDLEGKVVMDNVEKKQDAYDHAIEITGLDPTAPYQLEILAKDLNQNERNEFRKLTPSSD